MVIWCVVPYNANYYFHECYGISSKLCPSKALINPTLRNQSLTYKFTSQTKKKIICEAKCVNDVFQFHFLNDFRLTKWESKIQSLGLWANILLRIVTVFCFYFISKIWNLSRNIQISIPAIPRQHSFHINRILISKWIDFVFILIVVDAQRQAWPELNLHNTCVITQRNVAAKHINVLKVSRRNV